MDDRENPLGNLSRTPTFKKFSDKFKYRSIEYDEDLRHQGIWVLVGRILNWFSSFSRYLRVIYLTVLGNFILLCMLVAFSKYIGWEPYQHWGHAFLPLSNWYFQFANLFLIVSYAMNDYLLLRICLCCGCACFVLFGVINPAGIMPDTVIYNSCMVFINGYFIITTIWEKRHIDFSPEWELVYGNHFEGTCFIILDTPLKTPQGY